MAQLVGRIVADFLIEFWKIKARYNSGKMQTFVAKVIIVVYLDSQ